MIVLRILQSYGLCAFINTVHISKQKTKILEVLKNMILLKIWGDSVFFIIS